MSDIEQTASVIDDAEHTNPDQVDIGNLDILDGDPIPEDLDVGDLDILVANIDVDIAVD